jgi:hypothetical protein
MKKFERFYRAACGPYAQKAAAKRRMLLRGGGFSLTPGAYKIP